MLIAVEGCIAAGKTTVATGLAELRGERLLLEDFDLNPFLREFYRDPVGNVLETEFAFLLVHYHQLKKSWPEIRERRVVADFHLGKDLLFAEMNMKEPTELDAFRQLNILCSSRIANPDLLVLLSAPLSLIVSRVSARARDFEQNVPDAYYEALLAKYEDFYEHFPGAKLRIDMGEWDFVQQPVFFNRLSSLIDELLPSRKNNG